MGRILYLLYKTSVDPINYPIETLTWWMYFLIFEIWCSVSFKTPEESD